MLERKIDKKHSQAMDAVVEAALAAIHVSYDSSLGGHTEVLLPHPFSNMTHAEWATSIKLWKSNGVPLLETLLTRECPACGATDSDAIFESYDGYIYHECITCKSWYVPKKIDHEVFEKYFQIVPEARRFGDYTEKQHSDSMVTDIDKARFRGYYDTLSQCSKVTDVHKPTTLDIGCGVANSLTVADEFGFETTGIEVNKNAVKIAQTLGRNVRFPSYSFPAKSFNVITLWETLEHLADPLAILEHAHGLLQPDGVLALTLPNLNSPSIRSMRGDSLQIHGGPAWPGHINLFTPATLEILLKRAGFTVFHISGQYSMNLFELAAYHTGAWSGARDYLRLEAPTVKLPWRLHDFLQKMGPASIIWEDAFAYAPIMQVFAHRSDGSISKETKAWLAKRNNAVLEKTSQHFSKNDEPQNLKVRGKPQVLSNCNYIAATTEVVMGERLLINAINEPPFGYLWMSKPFSAPADTFLRVRGKLHGGGIQLGVQEKDNWVISKQVTTIGVFEIVLPAQSRDGVIVIANQNDTGIPTKVSIDCVETVARSEK